MKRKIASMRRSPVTASKSRIQTRVSLGWAFLNSAFFLWFLTTIAVGTISTIWSERIECRATYTDAEQRFVRSLSEYQYRQAGYHEALRQARSPAERDEAEEWKGSSSPSAQHNFQSRTMADVALEMLRAFGDLALVSDLESFDIGQFGLSLARQDGTIVSSENLGDENLKITGGSQGAGRPIPGSLDQNSGVSIESRNAGQIHKIRNRLYNDNTLRTVRNAAMLKPIQKCGTFDVLGRQFKDSNPAYRKQVDRLFSALLKEQHDQMLQYLAIEQLISQPASQNSSTIKK